MNYFNRIDLSFRDIISSSEILEVAPYITYKEILGNS